MNSYKCEEIAEITVKKKCLSERHFLQVFTSCRYTDSFFFTICCCLAMSITG